MININHTEYKLLHNIAQLVTIKSIKIIHIMRPQQNNDPDGSVIHNHKLTHS